MGGGGGGGGAGQEFPNDEKNFRIFHGIRSHEGVCYPENEDAIYKQKYAYFMHRHITEALSAVGQALVYWGGGGGRKTRAGGPMKFLNLESLKRHLLDFGGRFDRIPMFRKKRFSMSKFTICLQFSSTKWAKAYLINYTVYWRSCKKVWVI